VIAAVILDIVVIIPFGTVSVVVATFPCTVLKLAVLVIAHEWFISNSIID
jgi:hypothetical protein